MNKVSDVSDVAKSYLKNPFCTVCGIAKWHSVPDVTSQNKCDSDEQILNFTVLIVILKLKIWKNLYVTIKQQKTSLYSIRKMSNLNII